MAERYKTARFGDVADALSLPTTPNEQAPRSFRTGALLPYIGVDRRSLPPSASMTG